MLILLPLLPCLIDQNIVWELQEAIILPPVSSSGRIPVPTDPVAFTIAKGDWQAPTEGETFSGKQWQKIKASQDAWMESQLLRGGYVSWQFFANNERTLLLEAAGHSVAYVNGVPRAGDPYGYGYVVLPIKIQKGKNEILLQGARGRVRARITETPNQAFLNDKDNTLPDLLVGQRTPSWGAIVVVNPSEEPLSGAFLVAEKERTAMLVVPPMSARKIGFRIPPTQSTEGTAVLELRLEHKGNTLDRKPLSFRVRSPKSTHKRTFISAIDGSIQYYALNPAQREDANALILSVHGAGVEAIGQAEAYSPKLNTDLVCPTNRRPFGFDWEDWGRIDAIEVLTQAIRNLRPDPSRIYLTGHSMGGHGTWHIGLTYPSRFAAIGPSAGWISFWSYAGGVRLENPDPMQEMLQRSATPSDTIALLNNAIGLGIYILHGSADDNVPASESRTMAKLLEGFHRNWIYHEEPGQGHWWDKSEEPGADCVDWPPMFDFFARQIIPKDASVRNISFVTANPGVSSTRHWITIQQQITPLKLSRVEAYVEPILRRYTCKTENTKRLTLSLEPVISGEITAQIDDQKIEKITWPIGNNNLEFKKENGTWKQVQKLNESEKGPHRNGPFKESFQKNMVFVYGTAGTKQENDALFAKARFDAETWWYRANGSVDLLPDTALIPSGRNVILYGNAETNRAWNKLLQHCPVTVTRTQVKIGEQRIDGNDVAILLCYPRYGSKTEMVAVVSGTGTIGQRLTWRLPYFVSGVAYPDLFVMKSNALLEGLAGVKVAGFFGTDWSVEKGEFVWQ